MEAEQTDNRSALIPYFLLAFAFSWLLWIPAALFDLPFPVIVLVGLGAHGPTAAALVLTGRSGGWPAVKNLLRRGFDLRLGLKWWALALILPLALGEAAVLLNGALSGYRPDASLLSQPWMIAPTFLFMLFLGGSVQEEFGWRGYALPRLLARWNPLLSSLVLGLAWGLWHLPLFFVPGVSQAYMPFPVFLGVTLGFSFLFTWVYLRSGRNLFSALLLHTAINTYLSVFPPIELQPGGNQAALAILGGLYLLAAAVMLAVSPRFWLKRAGE